MQQAEDILRQYWKYNSFRPLQKEIIESILGNRDTLALLPTGGGKSLCYQVPALMRNGFTLVISPLIALMQDQVARLKDLDIPAACIHSGMPYMRVKDMLTRAMEGNYKLLYVSPERLQTALFRDFLPDFDLNLLAVDEAHCISQWGHDFRPDYLRIASIREEHPDVPVLAVTASATPNVRTDIAAQLELRSPALFVQSFSRPNIFYQTLYTENKPANLLAHSTGDCEIVYCRSRRHAETVGQYLAQNGIPATTYHAGMKKDERDEAQEKWMKNEVRVMTATTAFGMGIDKPDVRMVLHYEAPEHLEGFYQEAGRAGRDGKPSEAVLLFNQHDIQRLHDSTALQYPSEAYLRRTYQAVVEYLQIPIGAQPDQYYAFDLFDFSKKFGFRGAEVIYALKLLEREGLWTLTESVHHPATVQFLIDRHALDAFSQAYPNHGYLVVGLLRMYNTVFHYPTYIRESAVAKQLRMPKAEVQQRLDELHKLEVLEYVRPGEGPQLFFHHYRVDSRFLIIDMNRINTLKKRHEERTAAIIAYLRNCDQCRERILLSYFGENTNANCGHCDICRNKTEQPVSSDECRKIILGLLATSPRLTVSELTQVTSSPAEKQAIISVLRTMADEGVLLLDATGTVTPVPKK